MSVSKGFVAHFVPGGLEKKAAEGKGVERPGGPAKKAEPVDKRVGGSGCERIESSDKIGFFKWRK